MIVYYLPATSIADPDAFSGSYFSNCPDPDSRPTDPDPHIFVPTFSNIKGFAQKLSLNFIYDIKVNTDVFLCIHKTCPAQNKVKKMFIFY
jgi:hypothetical protein